jgi:hypothetical protein
MGSDLKCIDVLLLRVEFKSRTLGIIIFLHTLIRREERNENLSYGKMYHKGGVMSPWMSKGKIIV